LAHNSSDYPFPAKTYTVEKRHFYPTSAPTSGAIFYYRRCRWQVSVMNQFLLSPSSARISVAKLGQLLSLSSLFILFFASSMEEAIFDFNASFSRNAAKDKDGTTFFLSLFSLRP
jgi:hypothetical protein